MELFCISRFPSMVSCCIWQKDVTCYRYSYPKLVAVSNVFASQGNRRQSQVSSSGSRVSDGYARAQNQINYLARNTKFYRSLGSCIVVLPPNGRKPHAIVKFLGGAFIGAIPEVFYSYFIKILANEGFLVIAVPYNVTFDHAQAANDVYKSYTACLAILSTSGLPDMGLTAQEFVDLPLYSVGHSNGALLQAITGSCFSEKIPEANVIISFNNRPASEAVPYFEQLGPLLSQIMPIVEASPLFPMTKNASDAGKFMLDIASAMVFNNDQEAIAKLMKFSDQLPVVIDQITKGVSEFKPNPSENRDLVLKSYNVKHTLLVKFNFDTIDDTDLLEASLRPRVDSLGGTIEKLSLAGTHLTPCMQGLNWRVGRSYTPTDAAAQVLRTTLLRDINILSSTVSRWLKRYAN